jgi:hypothetical protein
MLTDLIIGSPSNDNPNQALDIDSPKAASQRRDGPRFARPITPVSGRVLILEV